MADPAFDLVIRGGEVYDGDGGADVNIIDMDQLRFGPAFAAHDLPGGEKRLMQKAVGYTTIVAGEVTYRNGEPTGAKPGHLVRSGNL